MSEQPSEIDMGDPETRARYEEALRKWEKKLKPLTDSIRRSQRITAEDLNILVGPCSEVEDE